MIWAVQNGYFDAVEVQDIVKATSNLRDFCETRGVKLMDTIRSEKAISEETENALKTLLDEWKIGFSA